MEQAAKVVEALMRYGPRYLKISKETGVPVTTVRYIIREKLPKLGFIVSTAINYGMLGLQRYLVILETSLPLEDMCSLLDMLGERAYLNYYTYLMKEKKFLTIFSIPPSFQDSFINFLDEMSYSRLITNYVVNKLEYRRLIPFRTDCFDFNHGIWSQNWDEKSRNEDLPEIYERPTTFEDLKSLDLKILGKLSINTFMKCTELAEQLKVTRQTIKRHYEKIRRVIYMYSLLWMPHENPELVSTPLIVKLPYSTASRRVMLTIPFSHLEMKTDDEKYYVMLFLPSLGFYKTIRYMSERADIELIDFLSMRFSANFLADGLPYVDGKGWIDIFGLITEKILEKVKMFK
ncbi:MAG: hypothetical protein ABDH32_03980 [Candidatus Caldarchaeales archaeon]